MVTLNDVSVCVVRNGRPGVRTHSLNIHASQTRLSIENVVFQSYWYVHIFLLWLRFRARSCVRMSCSIRLLCCQWSEGDHLLFRPSHNDLRHRRCRFFRRLNSHFKRDVVFSFQLDLNYIIIRVKSKKHRCSCLALLPTAPMIIMHMNYLIEVQFMRLSPVARVCICVVVLLSSFDPYTDRSNRNVLCCAPFQWHFICAHLFNFTVTTALLTNNFLTDYVITWFREPVIWCGSFKIRLLIELIECD